jgi:predicted acylesterase/phospholipase RssA
MWLSHTLMNGKEVNMDATTKSPPRKEVRIGLVLYGGVSLAIYIYGVVFEFLRAVRAAQQLEKNAYSAIFDQTHSRLTVDIVSGTSAGGINGVLLSKALCNGLSTRSFERVRSLWLSAADFTSLFLVA